MNNEFDIIGFSEDFRHGIIGDNNGFNQCFVVSLPLHSVLNSIGIECELVRFLIDKSNSIFELEDIDEIVHYCIKIGNKILDPTSDQFKNMPKVFMGSRPIWYKDYTE